MKLTEEETNILTTLLTKLFKEEQYPNIGPCGCNAPVCTKYDCSALWDWWLRNYPEDIKKWIIEGRK